MFLPQARMVVAGLESGLLRVLKVIEVIALSYNWGEGAANCPRLESTACGNRIAEGRHVQGRGP